ncbi:MAG: hypothetical protein OHK0013_43040 [Sandaracinaceae bacterium]
MDKQRPTSLIVVAVLSFCLGGLGLIGGCMGVFSALAQDSVLQLQEQLAQGNPQMQAQLEPQRRMVEAQAALQIPMIAAQLFNLVGSVLLIAGAGLLVALKRAGLVVYVAAAAACALADIANGALGMYATVQAQEAMAAAMAGLPGQDQAMMGAAMQAGSVVGLLFGVVWIAVKLVIYAFGVWTSRSEAVQSALS